MQLLQKENLILEKQVHSYQTAIAQKDSKGEYDPMATRPQPPGQAQPGYGDMDRMHNSNQLDAYGRPINNMGLNQNNMGLPNQMGVNSVGSMNSQNAYPGSGMGVAGHGMGMQGHGGMGKNTGYDTGYTDGRNDLGAHDPYERQHQPRPYPQDGVGGLPVPADRNPRSRSADPTGHYVSPVPERRPNRRNSTTGAEYADQLEQSPNSRYNRHVSVNDGYRSDSGYRSDTMGKSNDPRDPRYNEHYTKDGRPRPSMRAAKHSDSRSDYGDYYSERRHKPGYERDIDAYSDRSHKSSGGSRSARSQPIGDSRPRNNILNSNVSSGRASYAGYENDYLPQDNGRAGSSYPNTPRTGSRGGYSQGDRRPMENGPR